MATELDLTTTYAGEFAGKYIGAALLSANTIEQGGVTVIPNIKYKQVVKRTDITDLVHDASCDYTPTGTVALTERILEPKELQVNLTLCKKDFRSDWDAVSMGYSTYDVLPKSFQDYFISRVLGQVAEANEISLWRGNGATDGQYQGLFTEALANSGDLAASIADVVITPANVIEKLGDIADAIPSTLYSNPDLKIYVSQSVAKAYVRALGGFGNAGLGAAGTNAMGTQWYANGSGLSFDGIPLFTANGLDSTISACMATTTSNVNFGCGLLNDSLELKLIDMSMIDGSQNVRFVMRYTAGTQIGILEDCVIYFAD